MSTKGNRITEIVLSFLLLLLILLVIKISIDVENEKINRIEKMERLIYEKDSLQQIINNCDCTVNHYGTKTF